MDILPRVSDRVVITSDKCKGQRGVVLEVWFPAYLILIEDKFFGLLYQNQFEVFKEKEVLSVCADGSDVSH